MKNKEVIQIPIDQIVPDESQPRKYFDPAKLKYLKDSIQKYGIMNPVTVEKIGEKYLLVDGERRFRASTDLKLKTIPSIILDTQNAVDRRIQQFHIQEQHEGWSATEKASTVFELSQLLKIPINQLGEMLGIEKNSLSRYIAFSSIVEKKEFQKYEISIHWTPSIIGVKSVVKNLYQNTLEIPFTRDVERKIEKAIINQIKIGELKNPNELGKLKDSFRQSPKDIESFIEKGLTVSELFVRTKAKSSYHLRNARNSAGYASTHINRYLENPHVIPTKQDISAIKNVYESAKKFLAAMDN